MSFVFKHPKYYKELKEFGKRGDRGKPTAASPNTDQAISNSSATAPAQRAPGPGLKQQAIDETVPHCDIEEATSSKQQASSVKPQASEASSDKHQAPSSKRQA